MEQEDGLSLSPFFLLIYSSEECFLYDVVDVLEVCIVTCQEGMANTVRHRLVWLNSLFL